MIKASKPTESELEILQILWDAGPSSVRDVNNELNNRREVGYTTTLKLMQIMNKKNIVVRNTDSRTHVYSANQTEEETKQNLLSTFLKNTFKGSATNLVVQALGSHEVSKEELVKIKELISKLEKGQ